MSALHLLTDVNLWELLLVPSIIMAIALTVGLTLNRIVKKRILMHRNDEETTWQFVFINALRGAPVSLSLAIGFYWMINSIDSLPAPLVKAFSYILFTLIVISITRIIARTVGGIIDMHMERSKGAIPKTTLLNAIVNGIIYAMGILVILQYYGISIAPIITALGVGGMAVALGLQETLANIFSGLHLILSKQLRIGDYIRLNSGEEGRVTDITWRFTTIIPAGDANVVVIPNQKIATSNITNFSLPHRDYVIKIPVGVSYDSDLEKVERVTVEVATKAQQDVDHKVRVKPVIRYGALNDSSIDFTVIIHTTRFDHQFLIKHEFIKALIKRYREENIDIPYPVRTVIMDDSQATQN